MTKTPQKDIDAGLREKAKRVLPGGSFGNFPGDIVIREGRGGRVWDESGKEYVDFLLGSMDEIMTFNRALNPTEISAIYSSGSAGLVHAPEVVSAQLTGPSQFSATTQSPAPTVTAWLGRAYTMAFDLTCLATVCSEMKSWRAIWA